MIITRYAHHRLRWNTLTMILKRRWFRSLMMVEHGGTWCRQQNTFFTIATTTTTKNVIETVSHSAAAAANIRNIGLVAHIDAGKTTTTERMLYYSGSVSSMGEVHDGDTVMDWMEQERERGITITAASATIGWAGHRINLLDTPGHVDFTFEVERSLSVLDGVVVILDGGAGVQAQTIKVWQQANRYQLPRLCYANKMDRPNASVERCINSIKYQLQTEPLLLQLPIYKRGTTSLTTVCEKDNLFTGLIDIVTGRCLIWSRDTNDEEGKHYWTDQLGSSSSTEENKQSTILDRSTKDRLTDEWHCSREQLIGQLSDHSPELADVVLTLDNLASISTTSLYQAIRWTTLQRSLVPLLLGSSYRNIGVQPLLDAVVHYLPHPLQNARAKAIFDVYNKNQQPGENRQTETSKLCALAFKITFDHRLGALTYLRLYSGTLAAGQQIYNLNQDKMERITKVYRPFADHFVDLSKTSGSNPAQRSSTSTNSVINVGDIVVVSGLGSTITGDTLLSASAVTTDNDHHHHLNDDEDQLSFAGIDVPDPVYYCTLESPSLSKQKQLELALEQLQREDPSFKVQHDRVTNQIVIKGMGELHIDIIKERIRREYGVDCISGPLHVSYQETINGSATETTHAVKSIGGVQNEVEIMLELRPSEKFATFSSYSIDSSSNVPRRLKDFQLKIVNTKEYNLAGTLKPWQLKAIQSGVFKALEYGPLFSFPVVHVEALLHQFTTTSRTSVPFIMHTATQCTLAALRTASPTLLEPIMRLVIDTPEQYIGAILSDLSGRRAEFGSLTDDDNADGNQSSKTDHHQHLVSGPDHRLLVAYVPLAELTSYSTKLRTLSSGMASFEMAIHSYRRMNERETQHAINVISGVYC